MIESVLSFTLQGRNEQLHPILDVFRTVLFQKRTITATIALSSFSQGISFKNGQVGFAGAFITKAGVAVAPNKTDNLPLDPKDVSRTQIHIENCMFVTFRLVISMAEASATATVFVEEKTASVGMETKSAYIYDRASGRVAGVHQVDFPAGIKLPSDERMLQRIRKCAAEAWNVSPRLLGTAMARAADPIASPQLVINAKSGRARASAEVSANAPAMMRARLEGRAAEFGPGGGGKPK